MISKKTKHPHPLPLSVQYILYFDTEKGEGGRVEPEKVRGATVYKQRWAK
jgi:hypothetical protein